MNIQLLKYFCSSHANFQCLLSKDLHIGEALQMQIEVQRRLNEQLEVTSKWQLTKHAFSITINKVFCELMYKGF